MTWQTFEPMDLFGEGVNSPTRALRGRFKYMDPDTFLPDLELELQRWSIGGKSGLVPRLEGWWGSRSYSFGGRVVRAREFWPQSLLDLKCLVQEATCLEFDSCFVNYYRDERDKIDWHADDEPWIVDRVASVSLGALRRFAVRRKDDHQVKFTGNLSHGDLLFMGDGCQAEWEHCVPRATKKVSPRLSFTFRATKEAS